jgi:hypothetical protein
MQVAGFDDYIRPEEARGRCRLYYANLFPNAT